MWPLHPQPHKYEPLSLWVERLAGAYGVYYRTFCYHALGLRGSDILELSENPSEEVLEKLAAGTGVPVNRLREMTIGSLMSQLQNEMQIALGSYERGTIAWLTEQGRTGYKNASEYWEVITYWETERNITRQRVFKKQTRFLVKRAF